jgi:protein-S-isoprenylcysteine O-methyltransferase Ste14
MEQLLRYILPLYFIVYFLFLIVIRAWQVSAKIGKNPVVLKRTDDAHGVISSLFGFWIATLGIYVIIYSCFPGLYVYLKPIVHLQLSAIKVAGFILLFVALVFTYVSQAHMRNSWRVGIDQQTKTELITTGIYSYSRNPIYVGIIGSFIGLFMVTPDVFTLLLLTSGFMLIQIQVRLEEEFLAKSHGSNYTDYKAKVARFI